MSLMRLRKIFFLFIFLLMLGVFFVFAREANASSGLAPEIQPTPFLTPTPGPDGRIVYIVQKDDSFWSIAAIAGITLDELYALNGIQPDDYCIPGTQLVLGLASPVEPTTDPNAAISPTSASPTSTPEFNTGEVCVLLFLDENGNARLDEGESSLSGGQISIVDVNGIVAAEATTEATTEENAEGQCFENIEAGDYNVSAAVPEEYNPTTSMSLPLRLVAGDIKYIQFGAQPSAAISEDIPGDGQNGSLWLGLFGIFLLLVAGGLYFYAARYGRRSPKLGK